MNIEIGNIVRQRLLSTAIPVELSGQNNVQLNATVNTAIDSIVKELTIVAGDSNGRQRLYEEASQVGSPPLSERLLDSQQRDAAQQEARVQLQTIVGTEGDQYLVDTLCKECELTTSQASDMLAFVSPGVIETLGTELRNGSVENSALGVATLLNVDALDAAETHVESVDNIDAAHEVNTTGDYATEHHAAKPGYQPAHSSGGAAVMESDNSWLMRMALPFLLLGALVIGSIKYCSDAKQNQVVVEERGNLQRELEVAQGDLQSTKAELLAVRDIPTDTATLQQSLASVTSERDAAIGSGSELQAQLEQVNAERDKALQQGETLTAELEKAQATITANEESIANIGTLEAEVVEITASRDDTLDRNIEYAAANAELLQQVESFTPTITDLESQVETLTSARSEIMQQQEATSEALEEEKTARQADVEQLSAEVKQLQTRVDESAPTIENLEGQVASLSAERKQLETELAETKTTLADERTGRKEDTQQLTAEATGLQDQLSQMLNARNAAQTSLKQQDDKVAEQAETISSLELKVASLEDANSEAGIAATMQKKEFEELNVELNSAQTSIENRDATLAEQAESLTSLRQQVELLRGARTEAAESASLLQTEIDTLKSDLQGAQNDIASRDMQLADRAESLAASNEQLESARSDIDVLTQERDGLMNMQAELQQTVDALNAEKVEAMEEIESRDEKLSSLTSELQTATSSGEVASSRIATLEASLGDKNTQLDQLIGERDNALATIDQANADISSLNNAKTAADNEINQLNQQAAELSDVLETERMTIADLETSLQSLKQEKSTLAQEFGTANGKIDELNAQLDTQASQLQQEQQTIAALNNTVAKLETEGADLTAERDNALLKTVALQQSLSASDLEISTLTDNRDKLQSQIDVAAASAESLVDETLTLRQAIENQLNEAGVVNSKVQSIDDNQAVAITLVSGSLYQTGDAALTREGQSILTTVGNIVAEYTDWYIDVEGHTDSLGIGAELRERYPTNWELSSARASAAVRHLKSTSTINADSLTASGFADTRPIADNSNAKGREQNRRVDIILRR